MPSRYNLNLIELISEVIPSPIVNEEDDVEINWSSGYLTVKIKGDRGGYEYTGAYHPNVVCEGTGICKYCGRTLEV